MNIFVWTKATNQVEYRIASQAPAQWTLLPARCRMVSGGRVWGGGWGRQSWGVRWTGTSPLPGNWMEVIGNYLLPRTRGRGSTNAGSFPTFLSTSIQLMIYLMSKVYIKGVRRRSVDLTYLLGRSLFSENPSIFIGIRIWVWVTNRNFMVWVFSCGP